MGNATLTNRSIHLLTEVAAGRNRIFYMDARPPGFAQAERAGYLVRIPDTDRAELTERGRTYLVTLVQR